MNRCEGRKRTRAARRIASVAPVSWQLVFLLMGPATKASEATNTPSFSPAESQQWSVSVRWENDTFGGTDRFYTDGASLSLLHTGGGWLNAVADWLPWGSGRRCVSYDLGQIVVTPNDKSLAIPDPSDRPYAGILYAGISLHVDHSNSYHGLKLTTGVVGPWSFAEQTQEQVHRWINSEQPQGWDYQLHNEPLLNLVYEHRRKYRVVGAPHGPALEALPTINVMLGNLLTQGQIGGQLRIGYNIPDDFGTTLMRGMGHLPPPRQAGDPELQPSFGIYFYGGVHGYLILRNITLDGNTWKDSPDVDKKLFVPSAELGLAVATRRFMAAFSYVFFGREFERQPDHSEFGAFTVTYRF